MSSVATQTVGGPGADEAGTKLYGLMAEFDSPAAIMHAAERVRDAGFRWWDCCTPFPVHGLDQAMGIRPTILPWLVFFGGATGTMFGLGLQAFTNATSFDVFSGLPGIMVRGYDFLISGKPLNSLPAWIPVIFELTVLFSALGAAGWMLLLNGLPRLYHPCLKSRRFARVTDDRFFLVIEARDPRFFRDETEALLESLEPLSIEALEDWTAMLPKPFKYVIAILLVLALVPPALIARARTATSDKPRVHMVQDMDNQLRLKAQQASPQVGGMPLFNDGRAMRPTIPGTVARGELGADRHYHQGVVGRGWASDFPAQVVVDLPLLQRGRERFEIYCAPCHGLGGFGDGPVHHRAEELLATPTLSNGTTWVPPKSVHDADVAEQPVGQIFNSISNGVRNMAGYASQIPVADRWAIVAYVRALQRSRDARPQDVPDADGLKEIEIIIDEAGEA